MKKDMEQVLQEKVREAAELLLEGEYAASMQVIRLTVSELNDEKVTELMQQKMEILTGKCNATIDAIKTALMAEEIDGHVISQNIRFMSAINVQWMAEQYYSFFLRVLSEQGYYQLS